MDTPRILIRYENAKVRAVKIPKEYLEAINFLAKEYNISKSCIIVTMVRETLIQYGLIPQDENGILRYDKENKEFVRLEL